MIMARLAFKENGRLKVLPVEFDIIRRLMTVVCLQGTHLGLTNEGVETRIAPPDPSHSRIRKNAPFHRGWPRLGTMRGSVR